MPVADGQSPLLIPDCVATKSGAKQDVYGKVKLDDISKDEIFVTECQIDVTEWQDEDASGDIEPEHATLPVGTNVRVRNVYHDDKGKLVSVQLDENATWPHEIAVMDIIYIGTAGMKSQRDKLLKEQGLSCDSDAPFLFDGAVARTFDLKLLRVASTFSAMKVR
eukprot:SAG11_NODE_2067_length_3865_cov_1.596389_3_plen_163_part_01